MKSMKKHSLRAAVAALALGSVGVGIELPSAAAQATGGSVPSGWSQLVAPKANPSAAAPADIVEWTPRQAAAEPMRLPFKIPFLSANEREVAPTPQPQSSPQMIVASQAMPPRQPMPPTQPATSSAANEANFSVAGFSSAHAGAIGSGCEPCQSGYGVPTESTYASAMSSDWESGAACSSGACGSAATSSYFGPSRPSLFPWFGSAGLTFWNLEGDDGRLLATGLGNDFDTSQIDADSNVGFDIGFGRYLGCGKYGIGVNYMRWDPNREQIFRSGGVGTIRAAMPAYIGASVNLGAGPLGVYGLIDNYGINAYAERDLSFQGIEANLFSFGLMGAQRAAYAGCSPGPFGLASGLGFGGAAGPLARSNSGRLRISTSHGFRWFQIQDDLQFAFGTAADPAPAGPDYAAYNPGGLPSTTIHEQMTVENNLYGYQFGGNLTYCLGSRLNLNIGGKFGVYGNYVEAEHSLYTDQGLAYINTSGVDDIRTESSNTVLSTLGELDLGLGYRVSNAWTVRGGYRVLGVSGVASSVNSVPRAYTTLAELDRIDANDSFLLHGAYVGLDFNW